MAVFTYIATAIVTALQIGATYAAFATSVIATGLAAITSRIINGTGARGGSGRQDQGVRVQLPPNTELKIPVIYGDAFQQGIITDARISDNNSVMTYVLTLSEQTDTGSYSLGKILWNDQELAFQGDGVTVSGSYVPTNTGTTFSNTLDGLVKVYVYAGGSTSTYQIQGPTPAVNAYDVIPDCDASYSMNKLVFAVVQLTYSGEKGVTGLPTMTFQIKNTLKNPGSVWYDYITNTRYGAGFTATDVNTWTSIASANTYSLYSISNEIPPNQFTAYNTSTLTTSTATRYEINGIINTGDTAKANLEKINLASASFTTFDHKSGQWKVVPNRKLDSSELDNCYVFNFNNIIGDISLTATSLEDLYNQVEVSFANENLHDQTDYFKYNLPQADRNQLEPDNKTQVSLGLVNDYVRAARIGYIELLQSRSDLVVQFQATYEALQVEAGDVVLLTNDVYGFTRKPFRVTRMRETEGEDGSLVSEVTAIEYTTTVYTDFTITDTTVLPSNGIPPAGDSSSYPAPSTPFVDRESYFTFFINTFIDSNSLPVDSVEFWFSLDTVGDPTGSLLAEATTGYVAGELASRIIASLDPGDYYFKARVRKGTTFSNFSAYSTVFTWEPEYNYGGIIP